MPSADVLIAFTALALLMNISPGPSNLYVMARAIAQGMKGGAVAALGLTVGTMVHVLATVLGLSAIFSHSPTLYTAIKLAGAAYLVYLGISYWKSNVTNQSNCIKKSRQKTLFSVFKESIIVEVTNPKTALFFIALLPQFVVPESGSVSLQLLVLGIIVTLSVLPCDMLVAFFASKMADWMIKNERAQQIQERISGSILLGMGAYIVADELINAKQ